MANFMSLNEPYKSDTNRLTEAFELATKSEKQTKVLLAFVQLSRNKHFTLPVSDICQLAGVDSGVIQALAKRIFYHHQKKLSRIYDRDLDDGEIKEMQILSEQQISALDEIKIILKAINLFCCMESQEAVKR